MDICNNFEVGCSSLAVTDEQYAVCVNDELHAKTEEFIRTLKEIEFVSSALAVLGEDPLNHDAASYITAKHITYLGSLEARRRNYFKFRQSSQKELKAIRLSGIYLQITRLATYASSGVIAYFAYESGNIHDVAIDSMLCAFGVISGALIGRRGAIKQKLARPALNYLYLTDNILGDNEI